MKTSTEPNLDILGVPIGDLTEPNLYILGVPIGDDLTEPNLDFLGVPIDDFQHCSAFIASKHAMAVKLLESLESVGSQDHVALTFFTYVEVFANFPV